MQREHLRDNSPDANSKLKLTMSWQDLGAGKEIEENGVIPFLVLALRLGYLLLFDDNERTEDIRTVLALGLHYRL